MATAIIITGYLPASVTDNQHRSAREASGFLKGVIKKAGGAMKKIEVLTGVIFITTKDQTGVPELKNALSGLEGVLVEEPSEAELVFIKTRARSQAALTKEKSAA